MHAKRETLWPSPAWEAFASWDAGLLYFGGRVGVAKPVGRFWMEPLGTDPRTAWPLGCGAASCLRAAACCGTWALNIGSRPSLEVAEWEQSQELPGLSAGGPLLCLSAVELWRGILAPLLSWRNPAWGASWQLAEQTFPPVSSKKQLLPSTA